MLWLDEPDEGGGAIFPPGGGGRSPTPAEPCGRGLSLFLPCCLWNKEKAKLKAEERKKNEHVYGQKLNIYYFAKKYKQNKVV